jgi:hypothetical protein
LQLTARPMHHPLGQLGCAPSREASKRASAASAAFARLDASARSRNWNARRGRRAKRAAPPRAARIMRELAARAEVAIERVGGAVRVVVNVS